MNRLKDEMEAVARELQNNNNMLERYFMVFSCECFCVQLKFLCRKSFQI